MPVDPTNLRNFLVIHGVETGRHSDQHQNEDIAKSVTARSGGIPVQIETADWVLS